MAKIIVQDTEMLHNPDFNCIEFGTIRNPIEFEGDNQIAILQMQVLEDNSGRNLLK